MTGFEFIAKAFRASYTDIAKRLNLTTSTVADWASGRRPIPKDKLPLVTKLFRIDEEYFKKKELTEVEKTKIEINYLERASKRDSHQIPDTIRDEEGNEHEVYSWYNPHAGELRYKYEELAYEELTLRLKQILNHDFNMEMEYHRTQNHFHVVRMLADLLGQDDSTDGMEEFEDISEEEIQRRKKVSKKVYVISRMLYFLNGGELLAFGNIDELDKEIFHFLHKLEMVDTEFPDIEKCDEPFDHVDPKYKRL